MPNTPPSLDEQLRDALAQEAAEQIARSPEKGRDKRAREIYEDIQKREGFQDHELEDLMTRADAKRGPLEQKFASERAKRFIVNTVQNFRN